MTETVFFDDVPFREVVESVNQFANYAAKLAVDFNDKAAAQNMLNTTRQLVSTCLKTLPTLFDEDQKEFGEYTDLLNQTYRWMEDIQTEINLM